MDVEDSIPEKNLTESGESSSSNPEIAAGSGVNTGERSGVDAGNGSNPQPQPVAVVAGTGNGAPEENAEPPGPSVPEVVLVPLPPNFGEDKSMLTINIPPIHVRYVATRHTFDQESSASLTG